MNQLLRYIFGSTLLLIGTGAVSFSVYLAVTNGHVSLIYLVIPLGLGGFAIALAGLGLFTGERVRDIFTFLFTGLWI